MITIYENTTQLVITGDPDEISAIVLAFRFRPNGYHYALSYQRYKVSDGEEGWDGYACPIRHVSSTSAKAPRGYRDELIAYVIQQNYEMDLSHLLDKPFSDIEIDDVRPDLIAGDHLLDMNQRQCILDWLRSGIGFNKITVGGGKTSVYGGAAALIKESYPEARFMYVTPSERLVRQVTHEMKKFLPHFDVGQCGGGHKEFDAKDMVVCTVAMLNKHFNRLRAEKWFDSFMAILYDEVHHCCSDTSKRVLQATPAYFRLGASDTDKIDDPQKFNDIRGAFGSMLNEVKAMPLIEIGRLAQPHIYVVDIPSWIGRFRDVPHKPTVGSSAFTLVDGAWLSATYAGPVYELDDEGKTKTRSVKTATKTIDGSWLTVQEPVTVPGLHLLNIDGVEHEIESRWCLLERMHDRAIIQFKQRNETIVSWAKYFHQKGWPMVVVATRTTHVYILESLLQTALGKDSVNILVGDDSPAVRDDAFDWLKSTPGACLVTPLVKEGVSINAIRALIVADVVSDYEVARQIIGRAMRPKAEGDNRAHVVWFWDKQHPVLRKGCAKVLNRLERTEGFKFYHPCAGPESVFTDVCCSEKA